MKLDLSRASEYTEFILKGRLDVDLANARWSKEFMQRNGSTAEDLRVLVKRTTPSSFLYQTMARWEALTTCVKRAAWRFMTYGTIRARSTIWQILIILITMRHYSQV